MNIDINRATRPLTSGVSRAVSQMASATSQKPSALAPQDATVSVSNNGQLASELFVRATKYVEDNHLKPFTGPDTGNINEGAFLSVEKYNNYVFDKAASAMVGDGKKEGLELNKGQIVAALKANSPAISSIRDDDAARLAALGPSSLLTDLSRSDLSKMTDLYIAAKERGLDANQVEVVAVRVAMANRDQRLGVETTVYDPEKEKTGYGIVSRSVELSNSSPNSSREANLALLEGLGIGGKVVNLLLDSAKVGDPQAIETMKFLMLVASDMPKQKN